MIARKICQIISMVLLATTVAFSASPKRNLIGPSPLVNQLWNNSKAGKVPMWKPSEFHEQEFRYLGQTQSVHPYHLVNFITIWGQSHRATKRLLVFDSKLHFVGMYSHLDPEVKSLQGNILTHASGQADFSIAPPAKIENSVFESAPSICKGH
mgnify:CR=1 FL=1